MSPIFLAELRVYVTQITFGGSTFRARWDIGPDNWGTELGPSQAELAADFISTRTFSCECDLAITELGWNAWALDPATFNFSGTLWVRVADINEGQKSDGGAIWATEDHSNPALRPYLYLVPFNQDAKRGASSRSVLGEPIRSAIGISSRSVQSTVRKKGHDEDSTRK